ncbi:MAG TPA: phospho-N-acetylmuramoyl-pentapeptide-transferase [Chitinophagales bacterium]|nr:phospho-N-acetylmuramoyl-pentapeptide-transferase [Chitinophagales bacterium]
MLYHLFEYLQNITDIPGAGLFHYISFRSAMTILLSLTISMIFGNRLVTLLKRLQVGETVRDLGLQGQKEKEGTPTMGGLIILGAIIIPTVLFARLDNIYILLMLLTTVWMGFIGFLDDYIKVFKKDKRGLAGKFKIIGQVGLGVIVGTTLFFSKDVVISEKVSEDVVLQANAFDPEEIRKVKDQYYVNIKGTLTTIPFVKEHEIDYSRILSFLGDDYAKWGWVVFIPIVIFIVTAVSNGANLTDGLDGLATGTSAIIGATLGVFAYVSGNIIFSDYLDIMYIPNSGELVVYAAAFIGACVGFLWYNAYPAQVFMGDTGSLAIGGIIATLAIILRKELLIPILCGIFFIENLSVVLQVSYFKWTKKKYGEGRRIFKMSPLHHHYQKLGMNESKIATRFWIIGIMLAVLSVVTLKIR